MTFNRTQFLDACEDNSRLAIRSLQDDDITELLNDHWLYEKCIKIALDNLDDDVHNTYTLLKALVQLPGMKTKLLSISSDESINFCVYNTLSSYDRIMKKYIRSLKDDEEDRKLGCLIKLIAANQRYSLLCNTENTILDYSELEQKLMETKK